MQVNDNVNASNFLQGGGQLGTTNNVSKVDKKKEELNFSSFLVVAGSNKNLDKVPNNENMSRIQDSAMSDIETSVVAEQTDSPRKDKENDTIKNDLLKDSETITVKNDSTVSDDVSDEEQEVVLELANQIFQMIMNQFQLSAEELNVKLNEFGMDVASLLTGEGIREFFLHMESADISDLLVNEELSRELQEFMEGFKQIMEQLDSVKENLDLLHLDMEFDSLLMESSQLQETMETDFIPSEKELNDCEGLDETADEPEVVVSRMDSTKDIASKTDKKDEEASFSMFQQERESTEKTVVSKESKFENPILQAIDNAINQTQENMAVGNDGMVSGSDIIKQIVEQVRLNMNPDATSMELQLNPEHLGKVQINVASKEGVMTARIVVETEAAKQAVEGGLASLKETMEQQNLKVDAIEVMVSTAGFEGQDEKQDSYKQESETKNRKKLNLAELDEDVSLGDEAENLKMEVSGSSVSYMV